MGFFKTWALYCYLFELLFFTIKCLNGSLKDNFFVCSRAERGFKIVSSFIPFNQHRNQLTVYTYAPKRCLKQTNQPTSSHSPAGLVLASFRRGAWFFLFCFTWKPSPFHSEIRVWPQIPYLGWKSLLTWCLGIERGMRWKNWSSFSGNFFPWFLREVEEYFSSLSSLKE